MGRKYIDIYDSMCKLEQIIIKAFLETEKPSYFDSYILRLKIRPPYKTHKVKKALCVFMDDEWENFLFQFFSNH